MILEELLNLIPSELLNLIWRHVKPSIKYKINKYYFCKFYHYRFALINHPFLLKKTNKNIDYYIIKNFSYIKYLIVDDNIYTLSFIFNKKLNCENSYFIFNKTIDYEGIRFKNFIHFCYYYSKKFNSIKSIEYIDFLIKKYNLTQLIKKEHKNKNINYRRRNNIWTI